MRRQLQDYERRWPGQARGHEEHPARGPGREGGKRPPRRKAPSAVEGDVIRGGVNRDRISLRLRLRQVCCRNQSPASRATVSSAPGLLEEVRRAGDDLEALRAGEPREGFPVEGDHRTSLPPTIRSVGASTCVSVRPARSGRPPRDTTAPTPSGRQLAATSAAAAPVEAPKYPMRSRLGGGMFASASPSRRPAAARAGRCRSAFPPFRGRTAPPRRSEGPGAASRNRVSATLRRPRRLRGALPAAPAAVRKKHHADRVLRDEPDLRRAPTSRGRTRTSCSCDGADLRLGIHLHPSRTPIPPNRAAGMVRMNHFRGGS